MNFESGRKIKLDSGREIIVQNRLGEGGQGIVYKVDFEGKAYALKWYKPSYLKSLGANESYFKENLVNNASKDAPSEKFIWPKAVTQEVDGSFGYIMELKPDNYVGFDEIYLKKKEFASFRASVDCVINMVDGFRSLHSQGYFYLDLNDGNFFINPQNGDIRICDNDNVTASPKFNIGKPGYIAPELVRSDVGAMSSQLTDLHSLAVVLFKLLIRHDPLEGIRFVKAGALSAKKQLEFYGEDPVFIFDPVNKTNPPVNGLHPNPIKLWPMYPDYLQEAFIQTFGEGLKTDNKRTKSLEWKKRLLKLKDEIIVCSCGADIYVHGQRISGLQVLTCTCGKKYNYPHELEINKSKIYLFPSVRLTKHHIEGDSDFTEIGRVVVSKSDPNKWGLKNLSPYSWKVNGTEEIEKDKIAVIVQGNKIEFKEGKVGTIN